MAKPSTLPRWANVGGSVVTPPSGRLDIGWLGGEKPPAQYLNWLALHTYNWLAWLDSSVNGSEEWTRAVNAAAGQHVSVSGAGRFKHGDRPLIIPASAFVADNNNSRLQQAGYQTFNASAIGYAPVPLPEGKRIKTITVYYNPMAAASVRPALVRTSFATTPVETAIWTGALDGAGSVLVNQTNSPNYTIGSTEHVQVKVTMSGAGNRLHGAIIVFDEP